VRLFDPQEKEAKDGEEVERPRSDGEEVEQSFGASDRASSTK
jgi:hypothetical protein